ncbi:RNA polymerase sigma-70 factor [Puteibacter caeruleilacunae]|nr:RNA polymerase sigma-70 factor [Puteibacter caeruleilacunae]
MKSDRIHEEYFLVEELRKGNSLAFEVLYRKYNGKLFNFVRKTIGDKEEAAEIVQYVFIKLWEKRSTIDPSQSFSGFVFKIAKNLVYNFIRKSVREASMKEAHIDSLDQLADSTFDKVEFTELEARLKACIDKLPPRRKEVFILSRKRGMTYKEIAIHLNISENTVDTQIRKALQFLKDHLEDELYVYLVISMVLW